MLEIFAEMWYNYMEKPTKLTPEYSREIEKKLDAGYLVELIKLRDGSIVARTVKKKEISLPTA